MQYKKLQPVYFIGILEFEIGQNKNYYSRHKVLDIETKEQIIQDVEFNFIELPKFNKTIDELETSIDQWTYFIKNAANLSVIPDNVKDEGLKEAYLEADKHNWTQLELEDYLRASLKEQDDIGKVEFAVKKAVKIAEENAEKRKAKEIGKTMKNKGFPIETIIELTNLTLKEIEAL
jgi:predicted transposase/invertase (TIGR01784 family)